MSEFPWIHLGIGLVGNLLFVLGSICFFYSQLETVALVMFTGGSIGMFLGSLGELFIKIEDRRQKRRKSTSSPLDN